jgi:hypothetical protein
VAATLSTCGAAIYVSDPLVTQGIIVTDLSMAATLGGAFIRVPTNVVTEAVAARFLPAVVESAMSEVFAELSRLFSTAGATSRLYQSIAPGEPMPTDVIARAARPERRLDVTIRPQGYCGGSMSFLCA